MVCKMEWKNMRARVEEKNQHEGRREEKQPAKLVRQSERRLTMEILQSEMWKLIVVCYYAMNPDLNLLQHKIN